VKRFQDLRIRHQMNIIVCIAAALLVFTMGAVYIAFDSIMTRMAAERFHDLAERSGVSVRTLLKSIESNNSNYAYVLELTGFPEVTYSGPDMQRTVADAYSSILSVTDDLPGIVIVTIPDLLSQESFDNQVFYAGVNADAKEILNRIIDDLELLTGNRLTSFFTEPFQSRDTGDFYVAYVSPVIHEKSTHASGYLVSLFNYNLVQDNLHSLAGSDKRNFGLLYENHHLLVSTQTLSADETGELEELFANNESMQASANQPVPKQWINTKFRDKNTIALFAAVPNTNWTLGLLVARDVIKAPIISLAWIGLGILLLGAGILAVASVATIGAITKPVEGIVKAMKIIDNSHNYKEIAIPANNEVGIMALHINEMIHKLELADNRTHSAERRLYKADLARVRAELSYYQSQINPHFLYNTLESIRSMAVVYGAEEISSLAVATAGIFRYSVRTEGEITLRDEITCVEEYMTIMQLRFPNRYVLKLDIPENIMKISLLRMVLQPVVENCFKHGFITSKKTGIIRISASEEAKGHQISIVDNGKGLSLEKIRELQIELRNVSLSDNLEDQPGDVIRSIEPLDSIVDNDAEDHSAGREENQKQEDHGAGKEENQKQEDHSAGKEEGQKQEGDHIKENVNINKPNTATRVGLVNIHRRLQLVYGKEFGIKVESREGYWTKVTLYVP